ncbi:MAG: hypothetical protein HC850_05380, partial [Rhodomicrobium sp.]|nr:hypothetical protein [Rhodomicrobium sp.]
DATNVIAEGEVLQLMNMHDPDLAVDEYLRVIRSKTAKLFEASARLGAILAGADATLEASCVQLRSLRWVRLFSWSIDLLDYDGETRELGKNVGDDLREGKPTLPLLVAMSQGTDEERELIRHAIEQGEITRLPEVVAAVRRTGAIVAARELASAEAQAARICASALPPTVAHSTMVTCSPSDAHSMKHRAMRPLAPAVHRRCARRRRAQGERAGAGRQAHRRQHGDRERHSTGAQHGDLRGQPQVADPQALRSDDGTAIRPPRSSDCATITGAAIPSSKRFLRCSEATRSPPSRLATSEPTRSPSLMR